MITFYDIDNVIMEPGSTIEIELKNLKVRVWFFF